MEKNYQKGVILAFGELFLKSEGVKSYFKQRLIDSLLFYIKKNKVDAKVVTQRDRIFVKGENIEEIVKIAKNLFGISWYSECAFFPKVNLKDFGAYVDKNWQNWIKKSESFSIRVNLEENIIKENKQKVIERIARNIDRKVNLEDPKKEIFIEIKKSGSFVYLNKTNAQGGLPVGTSGKIAVLMSGGIDSPVAAYLMQKRGAENIWIHFHSFPLVSNKSVEKIKEFTEIFLNFQNKLKIYFIPFHKVQLEIKAKVPAEYRILLYRRLMFRVAEIIAEKEGANALATGESLGQVSSQTMINMKNIEEAVKIPVLRPLVGFDKQEIINLAKKIGSYKTSIKPHEDCCTLFSPKHSSAEGKFVKIKEFEKKLNIKKIIESTIKGGEIVVK